MGRRQRFLFNFWLLCLDLNIIIFILLSLFLLVFVQSVKILIVYHRGVRHIVCLYYYLEVA